MKQSCIILTAETLGYIKKDYGYRRVSKNYTHWVSIYSGGVVQIYGYDTLEAKSAIENGWDFGKIYDTGMIKPTPMQLTILIDVFKSNHK